MGSSQDVPAVAADLYEFEAVVTNTTKPIVFIGYSPRGMELVFEMAAEVSGGMEALREKNFLIAYPEPITPLVFPEEVIERTFIAADLFMPQIDGPTEQMGATAPVTLAGTIALAIAEGLMSITLVQLRKPGAPCGMSCNIAGFDMSTTALSIAAPETSLGLAAQAGIESAFSIVAQGLAGLNLIHDVGYMDMGMICSAEMLALGDEVIGMAKRLIRGIEVTKETLGRDVIQKVGPGGHFLLEDHTYHHFKNELWRPSLLTRQHYETWQSQGSKDMSTRVKDRVKEILETHKVPSLPDKTLSALKKLKTKGEKELT
jgi:trimethylamine--corrinoid protein Co-methyltransferase